MKRLLTWVAVCGIFASCARLGVYEQTKRFPKQEWASSDSVVCDFDISDTTQPYQVAFVLRHTDAFHFRNIWVNVDVKGPDSSYSFRREFQLAGADRWLGTGMDDIFDHRILFSQTASRLRKGRYRFVLRQAMREDPLGAVMAAGVRVETLQESGE